MLFTPFVGVNHHGQSNLLCCTLLPNEDTEIFSWLFTNMVKIKFMHWCAPNSIIIDQDIAMKNAIDVVFWKARHPWFLWHLMKNVSKRLG
jgi:hypothetical protein